MDYVCEFVSLHHHFRHCWLKKSASSVFDNPSFILSEAISLLKIICFQHALDERMAKKVFKEILCFCTVCKQSFFFVHPSVS
mmetsp:Transcript_79038/g.219784  ORF Transcript_79038/g.219784 Transcript_79038/m.219784 type:complete len:82 (+) Transcript_79038:578-823(+)